MGRPSTSGISRPSSIYQRRVWNAGLWAARRMPLRASIVAAQNVTSLYAAMRPARRQVVFENLLPVFRGDTDAAMQATKRLFRNFGTKVADLFRYEAGLPVAPRFGRMEGWDAIRNASRAGGVLLVTPHLGNWELGAPLLAQQGIHFCAVTQAEPGQDFTELRQAARKRWGIETIVVGEDPFSFVEIIRQLQDGATVALLVDRPAPTSRVDVQLFGRRFHASVAPAMLARASGCAVFPVYIVEEQGEYITRVLPQMNVDRRDLGQADARQEFTQRMIGIFEPVIQRYADQWYHFVPVWPGT